MKNFVETAEAGTHGDHGWPNSTYIVSKIGWSALSRIQQRMMDTDPRDDIVVNYVHPGWVNTDMTSHKGEKTVEEGAVMPQIQFKLLGIDSKRWKAFF